MYERIMTDLHAAGFEHYEISNWARRVEPGDRGGRTAASEAPAGAGEHAGPDVSPWRCRHNLLYWRSGNWVAAGPSGSSHVAGWRWKNAPHLGRYLASDGAAPVVEVEHLPSAQAVGEQLMMHLRLREGVPLRWIEAHLASDDPRHGAVDEHVRRGLLERTGTHLRLTAEGLMLADPVMASLL
jgi:oxygen-independent coproporphyrinogen-3 oxidase